MNYDFWSWGTLPHKHVCCLFLLLSWILIYERLLCFLWFTAFYFTLFVSLLLLSTIEWKKESTINFNNTATILISKLFYQKFTSSPSSIWIISVKKTFLSFCFKRGTSNKVPTVLWEADRDGVVVPDMAIQRFLLKFMLPMTIRMV